MKHASTILACMMFTFWSSGFVVMEVGFAHHPTLKGFLTPLLYIIIIVWATNDFARRGSSPPSPNRMAMQ